MNIFIHIENKSFRIKIIYANQAKKKLYAHVCKRRGLALCKF